MSSLSESVHLLARCTGRIAQQVQKTVAFVEWLVGRDLTHTAAQNQFEQSMLAQIAPLRSAVLLLLSRDTPSLVDKIQAGKAIVAAGDPQPKAVKS